MIVRVFLTLSLFLPLMARAGGAYEEMPGENVREREIRWAWKHLPAFLDQCRFSTDCALTPEQMVFAAKIAANSAHYSHASLQFKSEVEGGFTTSAGEIERMALTGSTPDSPIVINRDRYAAAGGRSLGVAFWMGLLTHEAVHHLGIPDDSQRIPDQLGAAIRAAVERLSSRVQFPEGEEQVELFILNPPTPLTAAALDAYPEGMLFRAMLIDGQIVVDEAAIGSIRETMEFCGGKTLVKLSASPDSAKVIPAPGGGIRAKVVFNGQSGCLDRGTGKSWGDEVFLLHLFGLSENGGRYSIDLNQEMNWGQAANSEGSGAFERGEILALQVPATAAAGSTLTMSARIRWQGRFEVVGCSAFLTSPDWPQDAQAQTTIVEPETCSIKPAGDGVYDVRLTHPLDADAPALTLLLQNFCLLIKTTDGDCIPAYPVRETAIQITRASPSTPLQLSGARFETGRDGQTDFVFQLDGAKALETLNITLYIDEAGGNQLALLIPAVTSRRQEDKPMNEVVRGVKVEPSGAGIRVRVRLFLPKTLGVMRPAKGQVAALYILTQDFKNIQSDLQALNLIIEAKD